MISHFSNKDLKVFFLFQYWSQESDCTTHRDSNDEIKVVPIKAAPALRKEKTNCSKNRRERGCHCRVRPQIKPLPAPPTHAGIMLHSDASEAQIFRAESVVITPSWSHAWLLMYTGRHHNSRTPQREAALTTAVSWCAPDDSMPLKWEMKQVTDFAWLCVHRVRSTYWRGLW